MSGWHILSTHDVPLEVFERSVLGCRKFCDHTFVWINNTTRSDVLSFCVESPLINGFFYQDYAIRSPGLPPIYDVPLRIAKIAQIASRVPDPDFLMFFDDDDEPPKAAGFEDFFYKWLASDSEVMTMHSIHTWGDFDTIRVNPRRTHAPHARVVKYSRDLSWVDPRTDGRGKKGFCFPNVDATTMEKCPWPLIHNCAVTREMRQRWHTGDPAKPAARRRDDDDPRFLVDDPDAIVTGFNAEWTWDQWYKRIKSCERDLTRSGVPGGCWKWQE